MKRKSAMSDIVQKIIGERNLFSYSCLKRLIEVLKKNLYFLTNNDWTNHYLKHKFLSYIRILGYLKYIDRKMGL